MLHYKTDDKGLKIISCWPFGGSSILSDISVSVDDSVRGKGACAYSGEESVTDDEYDDAPSDVVAVGTL